MGRFVREFSSGGIVIKRRRNGIQVLLIKDPYGKWTWPKGKIDRGESSLDAAKREIREETGLKNIEIISKVGRTDYYFRRDRRLIYKTVFLYLFRLGEEEPLLIQKAEIDDGKWYSEKEALSKVGYKGARALLRKALTTFKKSERRPAAVRTALPKRRKKSRD